MALNSIDSMNIPNQNSFVHEAEVDGIEILVNMGKSTLGMLILSMLQIST